MHKHLQELAKNVFGWEKPYEEFLKKYFTLILKIAILINCTGKFCYRHGNFQNTEAATEGFLENFTNLIGKRLCQSLFFNEVAGLKPANLLNKRLQHKCFSVNFVKFLRTTFFASDCFSKYESLCMAAGHCCPVKSCSENIWKISRSISASDCKFRLVTSSVKLKIG